VDGRMSITDLPPAHRLSLYLDLVATVWSMEPALTRMSFGSPQAGLGPVLAVPLPSLPSEIDFFCAEVLPPSFPAPGYHCHCEYSSGVPCGHRDGRFRYGFRCVPYGHPRGGGCGCITNVFAWALMVAACYDDAPGSHVWDGMPGLREGLCASSMEAVCRDMGAPGDCFIPSPFSRGTVPVRVCGFGSRGGGIPPLELPIWPIPGLPANTIHEPWGSGGSGFNPLASRSGRRF
jgi:hypothetical protein